MVFYRKYRPQKILELDSEEVREKLYSSLSGKSVAHAFLFTGPKGLGKTSSARIVAKAVNCEKRLEVGNERLEKDVRSGKGKKSHLARHTSEIEPCNKCHQCVSITNGSNLDVLEIDGASNRGIDEIRDLREKIRLSPISARKKVYIIDEVHMLTTEAFNALLKTLEEPPPHALFILCTTEPHKVPATIASRCFAVSFNRATNDELIRSFSRIAKGEKLNVDKDALSRIASLSDGSFRDGAKILEEIVLAAKQRKITKELVEEKYHTSHIAYSISKIAGILEKKDAKAGLQLVGELVEQGVDMKYFIEQLIFHLHAMLLVQVGVGDVRVTPHFAIDDIKKLVELLTRAHQDIKYAVLPQLPLELMIIEWSSKSDSEYSENSATSEDRKVQKVRNSDSSSLKRSGSPSSSEFSDLWQQLIEKVKPYNHSVAGVLRGCTLKSYDGKSLVIETGYKFHKERLEESRNLLEEVSGVKVSVVLKTTSV